MSFKIVVTQPGCAQLIATDSYPATQFLKAAWSLTSDANVLAFVRSTYCLASKSLRLMSFYSKWSDIKVWMYVSVEERNALSGMGKKLLLESLRGLPSDTEISLDSSGCFPWSIHKHACVARGMSRADIVDCLPSSEQTPYTDEEAWMKMSALLATDELAGYYERNFGFAKGEYDGVWSVRMRGRVLDLPCD